MARIKNGLKLFAGTANRPLAEKIAQHLGMELGDLAISRFSDGECYVKFKESVRGVDAFVVQPTCPPVDTNLVELLIIVDALRRASAASVTAVVPYYGYARQEKKDAPREPITAKLIADILTAAGANRIMTMDLHASAIQGFFNIPVDHLTAIPSMSSYFKEKKLENIVVVSTDEGRVKTVRQVSSRLKSPIAVGYKFHPEHQKTEMTHLAGDVKGKTPVIIEDIITTGGSINECVDALLAHGCKPEIYIAATHGILTEPSYARLNRPEIREVVVTDTVPCPPEGCLERLKVLSVAPLFAEAIRRVHEDESITSLFR
ncbi:MAG TPA: ribose-phosphate pyrophosphokinase [Armatimonadota bacterium]|nr:ribose-phosphate pyrophosphokinase [Armatimonadota bacterium]HPP74723.1 ribose-phosphate pyrophosphokinase [Armatimonadota bacterium]